MKRKSVSQATLSTFFKGATEEDEIVYICQIGNNDESKLETCDGIIIITDECPNVFFITFDRKQCVVIAVQKFGSSFEEITYRATSAILSGLKGFQSEPQCRIIAEADIYANPFKLSTFYLKCLEFEQITNQTPKDFADSIFSLIIHKTKSLQNKPKLSRAFYIQHNLDGPVRNRSLSPQLKRKRILYT